MSPLLLVTYAYEATAAICGGLLFVCVTPDNMLRLMRDMLR